MASATFRSGNPNSLARLLTISVVSIAMIFVSLQTAEARSRRSNIAIGVGAGIIGAIILNEAIKAEEQKKARRSFSKNDRRRSSGSVARSKSKSSKSDRLARTPKATQRVSPAIPRQDEPADVETGALSDDTPSTEAARFKFPLVFYNKALLQRFGVVVGGYGREQDELSHYRSKCYKKWPSEVEVTPDELYAISLSDDFVLKFAKRGFSLNSLCLAIASGVRFDPETGRRLPTFILADGPSVRQNEPGSYTNQIPLDVPDCFRFGRPYSNCKFVFDPISGYKLKEPPKRYADLGRQIDAHVAEAMAAGKWSKKCANTQMHDGEKAELLQDCKMEADREGWLQNDGIVSFNLTGQQDEPLLISDSWEKQRMIDVSSVFPQGYGYALYAPSGVGGPPPVEAAERQDAQNDSKVQSEATVPGVLAWLASLF